MAKVDAACQLWVDNIPYYLDEKSCLEELAAYGVRPSKLVLRKRPGKESFAIAWFWTPELRAIAEAKSVRWSTGHMAVFKPANPRTYLRAPPAADPPPPPPPGPAPRTPPKPNTPKPPWWKAVPPEAPPPRHVLESHGIAPPADAVKADEVAAAVPAADGGWSWGDSWHRGWRSGQWDEPAGPGGASSSTDTWMPPEPTAQLSDQELNDRVLKALSTLASSGQISIETVPAEGCGSPVSAAQEEVCETTFEDPAEPDMPAPAAETEGITMVSVKVEQERRWPRRAPVELHIAYPVQPKSPTEEPSPVPEEEEEDEMGSNVFIDVVGEPPADEAVEPPPQRRRLMPPPFRRPLTEMEMDV